MNFMKISQLSNYHLSHVISIYERDYADDSIPTNLYLESIKVNVKDGKSQYNSPKPLAKETLDYLAGYLHGRDKLSLKGFVPDRLIYQDPTIGNKSFIWYRPSQNTHLKFSDEPGLPEDGFFHLPTLVFMTVNKLLYVWAVKTKKATSKSRLYQAPLLNVVNGAVCLGTTKNLINEKLDKITDINELIEFWEDSLFNSDFNIGYGPCDKNINYEEGLIPYLKMTQSEQSPFSNDLLVPTEFQVKDLINF